MKLKNNEYKDEGTVNELNGVLAYKSSLPMKKDGIIILIFFLQTLCLDMLQVT